MTPQVIEFWERNKRELLRLTVSEYRGQKLVDLRVWFKREDGEYAPSQKGIAIKPELLDEVIAALKTAQAQLSSAR
jgi:hypothetical protein